MQIDEKLKEFGSLKTDVSLKEYNTFKVDSVVKYLVDVNSESDLINLISFLISSLTFISIFFSFIICLS